jgi:hypothetical protein
VSGPSIVHRRKGIEMSGEIEDPFHRMFFARIPKEVASSFSPTQLDAIKRAFGARARGAHAVDIRMSIPLGRRSAYLVLLAGKEKRTFDRAKLERLLRPLWTAANAAVLGCFLVMLAAAMFSVLYVGKRALNIDVFPGLDMLPDRTIERQLR